MSGTPITEFQPQNNKQAYLAYLCGAGNALPTPRSVEEVLLYNLCLNGGVGGGADFKITHCDHLFDGPRASLFSVLKPHIGVPTSAEYMFDEATGTDKIDLSGIDFSQCENFRGMFSYAEVPCIDVSSMDMSGLPTSGGANYLFSNCKAEEILGVGRNVNINSRFRDCFMDIGTSLRRLTFSPYIKGMNQYINITNCSFTRETMVEMFNSLPATCASTITITGNPCVIDGTLTAEDRAIATDKGCTLVEV